MKKIMWDKSHQNTKWDQGAVANGLREADLTEKIVDYAVVYMDANYTGFEQRVTRTNEEILALERRDDEADAWGADAFVSPHINAGGGNGYESYIYNKLSGKAQQQAVSFQNIMDNEILLAMQRFGDIKAHGGDPSRQKDLFVLRETNMTAILTENLYIDSSDSKYLKNEDFLKAVGEAHARGVAKFLELPAKEIVAAAASKKEDDVMNQKFEPSNQAIRNAVSTVLMRFEQKAPPLAAEWRDKANAGELTINEAVGLLFVAIERGYITGK